MFAQWTDSDFAGLDRDYYQRVSDQLTQANYRHLGDVVDATIEQASHTATPIRIFSSPDGTTTVSCYHVKPPEAAGVDDSQPLLICDVSCEFSDGSFLVTANTQALDTLAAPPQITKRQLPLTASLDELLRSHEAEKTRLLAAKSGVNCITISTLADAIESERRQQTAKSAQRGQDGFIDAEDVRDVPPRQNPDNPSTGNLLP